MFRLSQKSDYGLMLLASLRGTGSVSGFSLPAGARSNSKHKSSGKSVVDLRAVGNPSSAATGKAISIASIAKKNKISAKFLAQVANELKKAGIVIAKEGANGGYTLAKPAKEIKVLDVLTVLDGGLVKGECFEDGHECTCGAKDMWLLMKGQMEETLGKKTVADLVV